mgnify:CR=1
MDKKGALVSMFAGVALYACLNLFTSFGDDKEGAFDQWKAELCEQTDGILYDQYCPSPFNE